MKKNMEKFVCKNHQIIPETQAQISVNDRGFLFGDGIFETCKIFAGKIYDFKAHETRIKAGLKALKFSAEISDLEKNSYQLIKKNGIENGLLRIAISRGVGSIGYSPTHENKASIIIQTFDERPLPQKISLGVSQIKKIPKSSLPIHCKTAQGLSSTLVKIEAKEKNLFDCVMLSQENFIAETSSANIFWIKNGKAYTAAKSCDILLGTIRQKLIKIAPLKIFEVEAKISALKNADEIFLTNSAFLLLPVDEFLGRKLQKNFGNEFLNLLKTDVIRSLSLSKRVSTPEPKHASTSSATGNIEIYKT
jgi:branched-chain amino acid aminotransferase